MCMTSKLVILLSDRSYLLGPVLWLRGEVVIGVMSLCNSTEKNCYHTYTYHKHNITMLQSKNIKKKKKKDKNIRNAISRSELEQVTCKTTSLSQQECAPGHEEEEGCF